MNLYQLNSSLDELAYDYSFAESEEDMLLIIKNIEALEIAKSEKVLDLACTYKSLKAEAELHENEERKQREKRKSLEQKAQFLKEVISEMLNGEKIKDHRVSLYYMRSESINVEVDPIMLPPEFQRIWIEADKVSLKKELKNGRDLAGLASIQCNSSLVIK